MQPGLRDGGWPEDVAMHWQQAYLEAQKANFPCGPIKHSWFWCQKRRFRKWLAELLYTAAEELESYL